MSSAEVDVESADRPPPRDDAVPGRRFPGRPGGLLALCGLTAWERFSFLGVQAVLVLHFTDAVAHGGLGMPAGTAVPLAAALGALVHLASVAGGRLADRALGPYRSVLWGGALTACGLYALAVPTTGTTWVGLGLVVAGTGLVRPNAATLVGTLRRAGDHRRDADFALYCSALGLGALAGPVIIGGLGDHHGRHWGFAAAAVGMTCGLAQYATGRRHLTGRLHLTGRPRPTGSLHPTGSPPPTGHPHPTGSPPPTDPPHPTGSPPPTGSLTGRPRPTGSLHPTGRRRTRTPRSTPTAVRVALSPRSLARSAPVRRAVHRAVTGAVVVTAFAVYLAASGWLTLDVVVNLLTLLAVLAPVACFAVLFTSPAVTARERGRLRPCVVLFLASTAFDLALLQACSTTLLPAPAGAGATIPGFDFPVSWYLPALCAAEAALAPVVAFLWARPGRRGPGTGPTTALGVVLGGSASLLLVVPTSGHGGSDAHPMSGGWIVGSCLLLGLGGVLVKASGLSATTRLAPAAFAGWTTALWFLSAALAGGIQAQVARLHDDVSRPVLFGVSGAMAVAAGLAVLAASPWLHRTTRPVH
ncbi:peptide MFS transporter [Streptomyces sp. NPDC003247]|uniref:peptide MFS transporter n=1 Tax=Streptomyces sp. NPDC003247 TaxID=3364677 RepID=UPI0036AF122E